MTNEELDRLEELEAEVEKLQAEIARLQAELGYLDCLLSEKFETEAEVARPREENKKLSEEVATNEPWDGRIK